MTQGGQPRLRQGAVVWGLTVWAVTVGWGGVRWDAVDPSGLQQVHTRPTHTGYLFDGGYQKKTNAGTAQTGDSQNSGHARRQHTSCEGMNDSCVRASFAGRASSRRRCSS